MSAPYCPSCGAEMRYVERIPHSGATVWRCDEYTDGDTCSWQARPGYLGRLTVYGDDDDNDDTEGSAE